jgi:AcrR family transcriptional regulator
MSQKAIDTRGSRTEAALQQALKTLLRTKRYESIAVDEICKAANVGRSTFYTHFRSKDDLKRSGLETLRRQLIARQKKASRSRSLESSPPMSFAFDLFAHARDHLDHYRTLAGSRGGAVALRKLRDTVTSLVRAELASSSSQCSDATEREAAVQYAAGAFMGLLIWWLDRGATLSVEHIDALFQRFVREGLFSRRR